MPVEAASAQESSPIRLGSFVEAAVEAAKTLRLEEVYLGLGARMAHLLPGKDSQQTAETSPAHEEQDTSTPTPLPDADGEEHSSEGDTAATATSAADEALAGAGLPPRPSPDAVAAALSLMKEVTEVLKATVKPDTVMVLPGLPFPPPKRRADQVWRQLTLIICSACVEECIPIFQDYYLATFAMLVLFTPLMLDRTLIQSSHLSLYLTSSSLDLLVFPSPQVEKDVFVKLVQCFCSLTSLGGCPTVTCPVGTLRDGSPVAITLFAVQR